MSARFVYILPQTYLNCFSHNLFSIVVKPSRNISRQTIRSPRRLLRSTRCSTATLRPALLLAISLNQRVSLVSRPSLPGLSPQELITLPLQPLLLIIVDEPAYCHRNLLCRDGRALIKSIYFSVK